jgi:hypothetical protein
MTSQRLLFDPSPIVDPSQEPVGRPPVAGSTATSRHASWTGHQAVAHCWTERQSHVLQLLAGGPKSRQELSGLSKFPINSICSVVGQLLKDGHIERTGDFDVHMDGHGVTTKRERFRIRA